MMMMIMTTTTTTMTIMMMTTAATMTMTRGTGDYDDNDDDEHDGRKATKLHKNVDLAKLHKNLDLSPSVVERALLLAQAGSSGRRTWGLAITSCASWPGPARGWLPGRGPDCGPLGKGRSP